MRLYRKYRVKAFCSGPDRAHHARGPLSDIRESSRIKFRDKLVLHRAASGTFSRYNFRRASVYGISINAGVDHSSTLFPRNGRTFPDSSLSQASPPSRVTSEMVRSGYLLPGNPLPATVLRLLLETAYRLFH
jgi:hypothetical protein